MKIKASFPTCLGVCAGLTIVMGIALTACTKEETIVVNCGCGCGNGGNGSNDGGGSTSAQFYSPILTATTENYQAYNGYLEVVTCTGDEFAYYGNYSADDVLGSEPAYYEVVDGYAANSATPLRLPLGTYKFIYYGHDSKAAAASIDLVEPKLVVGSPLSGTMFELLQRTDTTYRPTHAFVLGYQEANVGSDSLHANLSQATAALKLTVSNSDGSAMSDAIDSIWIHVGSIAKHLSVTTGYAGTETVTVSTQLNRSDDALTMRPAASTSFRRARIRRSPSSSASRTACRSRLPTSSRIRFGRGR